MPTLPLRFKYRDSGVGFALQIYEKRNKPSNNLTAKYMYPLNQDSFFNPNRSLDFIIVSFLCLSYCNRFGEGIAGYIETERKARRQKERRNG